MESYSYFSYLNKPELLQVSPGLNDAYFNNNIPYVQLAQQVNIPTFFTNNYFNYRTPKGKFLQSYRIGFTNQWQQLNSNTEATQSNYSINNISDSFINKIQWQQLKLYANADYDYLGDRIKFSLSLPFNWQNINYSDGVIKTKPSVQFNQLLVNPTFNIKYAAGVENFVSANYTFGNSIANIQDVYGSYVLHNYNQLVNTAIPLRQSNIHNASITFNYRKTIKIFFANIAAIYTSVNNNSITQFDLFNNLQRQTSIPLNNTINSFTLFSGASKYLFKLHATVNIKASAKQSDWMQLQNGALLGYTNNTYSFSAGLTPKINKWLNMAYSGAYTVSSSKAKVDNALPQTIAQMQHGLEVNIFPNDNLFIKLKGEDFFVQQKQLNTTNNYFFADASARYKANKIKTDFVFEVSNLANVNQYTTANISANNLVQNSFAIRPRMLLVRAYFNF
jgi:hypothetical protein